MSSLILYTGEEIKTVNEQLTESDIQKSFVEKVKILNIFEILHNVGSQKGKPDIVLRNRENGEYIIVELKKVADYHVISQLSKYSYLLAKKLGLNPSVNPVRLCVVAPQITTQCKFACALLGIRYVELNQLKLSRPLSYNLIQDVIEFLTIISSNDFQSIKNAVDARIKLLGKLDEDIVELKLNLKDFPETKKEIKELLTFILVYSTFYQKSPDFRFISRGEIDKSNIPPIVKAIFSYDVLPEIRLIELLHTFLGNMYSKLKELYTPIVDYYFAGSSQEIVPCGFLYIMEGDTSLVTMNKLGYSYCAQKEVYVKDKIFKKKFFEKITSNEENCVGCKDCLCYKDCQDRIKQLTEET